MDKERLNKILDDLQISKDARSKYEDDRTGWERAYKNYKGLPNPSTNIYRNNLFIPISRETVDTFVPLVYSEPPFVTIGRVQNGNSDQAMKVRDLIQETLRTPEHNLINLNIVKSAAIYGSAFVKVYWKHFRKDKVRRKVIINEDGQRELVAYEDSVVEFDAPICELVNLLDIYPDPTATSMGDMRWLIERQYLTKDELETLIETLDGVKLPDDFDIDEIGTGYPDRDGSWTEDEVGEHYSNQDEENIEILNYWTADGGLVIVVDRRYIIYDGDNPFDHRKIPFLLFTIDNLPNELYGEGKVIPILALQEEINKMRNQRRDNVDFVTNAMFTVKRGSPLSSLSKIVFKSGAILDVNEHTDIEQIKVQDVTQTIVQEVAMLKEDVKSVTGMHEYIQGAVVPGMNKTSSGAMSMQNAAMKRILLTVEKLEVFFTQLCELYHELYKQFMTEDVTVKLVREDEVGEREVTVTMEDVQCDVQFRIYKGSISPVSKELKFQQSMTALQIVSNPAINQELNKTGLKINYKFFLNNLLDGMGIRDKTKAIEQLSPQEIEIMANQMANQIMPPQGQPQGGNNNGMA